MKKILTLVFIVLGLANVNAQSMKGFSIGEEINKESFVCRNVKVGNVQGTLSVSVKSNKINKLEFSASVYTMSEVNEVADLFASKYQINLNFGDPEILMGNEKYSASRVKNGIRYVLNIIYFPRLKGYRVDASLSIVENQF